MHKTLFQNDRPRNERRNLSTNRAKSRGNRQKLPVRMRFSRFLILNFPSDHAAELGNSVPSQPMLFMKSTSSYVSDGQNVIIPKGCEDMNQEVRMGYCKWYLWVDMVITASSLIHCSSINHRIPYLGVLQCSIRVTTY